MIKPVIQDDEFLADVAAAREIANGFQMWWLGQSGFLVHWQGRHLLIDPYLSDSLTTKYAKTDKPHIRMTELIVDPNRLDFIDVATSSHNHTDHLDGETLIPLMAVNSDLTIVVPEANQEFAADRLKVVPSRLTTVSDGTSASVGGFTFHGIPAAHDEVERDELGRCRFLGYVIEFGGYTIYHSGDTLLHDDLVSRLQPWSIDVAILPINGRAPERRVAGNLWGREAAQLAADIRAALVIPCHYDMFTFNTASTDEFVTTAKEIEQAYRVLQCGEQFRLGDRLR